MFYIYRIDYKTTNSIKNFENMQMLFAKLILVFILHIYFYYTTLLININPKRVLSLNPI